jgi:hypothetical protein
MLSRDRSTTPFLARDLALAAIQVDTKSVRLIPMLGRLGKALIAGDEIPEECRRLYIGTPSRILTGGALPPNTDRIDGTEQLYPCSTPN